MRTGDSKDLPAGLFRFDGDLFHPSDFTRGPWRPDAQHGGPPAALLAHVCEPLLDEREFLAQFSVELVRPVPLAPLQAVVERTQISGRVARIDARLESNGVVVAHATATVLATSALDEPEWVGEVNPAQGVPSAEKAVDPPRWASGDVTSYHRNAVEHRFTAGTFKEAGPAVDWVRLRLPVVAGHEPSGLVRLAAAADFGSGISAVYGPTASFGMINANLVISLHRALIGEWVSLDAVTHVGPQGTGLGITSLGDGDGAVGIATQTLLGYSMRPGGTAEA